MRYRFLVYFGLSFSIFVKNPDLHLDNMNSTPFDFNCLREVRKSGSIRIKLLIITEQPVKFKDLLSKFIC